MEAGAATTGGSGMSALRPLDIGQTLDSAVNLYTKNAVKLWTLVAVVMVPIYAIVVIIRRLTLPSGVFVHNGSLYTFGTTSTSASNVGLIVGAVLGLLGYLLATGAVFKLQLDAYLGRPANVRDSIDYVVGRHRMLSLLWVGIIETVMVAVGFILIIIPGIYLFVALAFAVPVLMLEGLRGMGAISRSMSLVSGRWWPTFGRLLVGLILYIVAAFVVGLIGSAITHGVSSVSLYLIINGIVSIVVAVFLAPFYAALINVTYIDLRVRKEGIDHDVLLSGGTPTGPPPDVEPLSGVTPATQPPASPPPASQPPPSPSA
jgi:hypothetical protein